MLNKKENISLKELLMHLKTWLKYLISKWPFIIIVSFIAAIAGFFYAYFKKPTYTAEVTFVLSSANQSGGALSSLAGQLGYNIGGSNNDLFEGENINLP